MGFFEGLLFGESLKFWITMAVALVVKWGFGKNKSPRVGIMGVLSGGMCAYYMHDFVIQHLTFFNASDETVVIILLCLSGEHLTRTIVNATPEQIISLFRGKK